MCHGVMAAACGLFKTLGLVVHISSSLCITNGVCECQVCACVCVSLCVCECHVFVCVY